MLETYIKNRLTEKDILLMTHIVLGYPSMETSMEIVAAMVDAGVDLIELQIPFSEPIADGPVILRANQIALASGVTVKQCLETAGKMARAFDIPFLLMTYYNILFKYGVAPFAAVMKANALRGAIVPDLPPEESEAYLSAMKANGLAPIYIFSPTTALKRMKLIAEVGSGFIYCVARKGVTGAETDFSAGLETYIQQCRSATNLPLALGFGVRQRDEIDFLKGKADIAVIGSEMIRRIEAHGVGAVKPFISSLR
ncbi:MAG: tryptophan synthase subunit alpha [Desulfobacterales bacterium]|jgi:tryptophan synthase alpha chain|nr:tryptophan synthase subunit alpha [Desulfobacterales bacterium]